MQFGSLERHRELGMNKTDSGFGRLIDAWKPAFCRHADVASSSERTSAPKATNESQPNWLPTSIDAVFEVEPPAATRIPVLIASLAAGTQAASGGAGDALAMRLGLAQAYRFTSAKPASMADLERLLSAQCPRLLLMDSAIADRFGAGAIRHLGHLFAHTQCLLLGDASNAHGFELAVACRARGCIGWDSSPEQFVHALRTVLGGDLWFARGAMQALYFTLVAACDKHEDALADAQIDPNWGGIELTGRESEALSLMRHGLTNQQIADRLDISINTVKKHLSHAFEKRGLHHRRQLLG